MSGPFTPETYQSGDGNLNVPITVGRLGQPVRFGGGTEWYSEGSSITLAERPSASDFGRGQWAVGTNLYISDGNVWSDNLNDIGIAGTMGFGKGICPSVPSGISEQSGTTDRYHDNYGDYIGADGSIIGYIPIHYCKYGTGSNGLAVNVPDIKPYSYFNTETDANLAGYFIPRAFYNAGTVRQGVFVDKYQCSNNGGVASSIKLGLPLSSAAAHNPFSALNGTPANAYYGSIAAVKTRGSAFFTPTVFIYHMLAMLSLAHGQAATSTTECAWYDSTGVKNFPKGNNNNALGDTNDTTLTFISDGYPNCAKTGSASNLAKTTHNGQANGIADLNGNMFEIALGMTAEVPTSTGTLYTTDATGYALGATSIALITGSGTVVAGDMVTFAGDTNQYAVTTGIAAPGTIVISPGLKVAIPAAATAVTVVPASFYLLNTSVDAAALTAGVTLTTDAWGAKGIVTNYTNIGATYESLTASSTAKLIGNAAQVFSEATTGTAWEAAGAGIPLVGGTGGTNMFGSDALYDYRPDMMTPVVGGNWGYSANAGVWMINLSYVRGTSLASVGFRAALFI
ncbi:MAG: hypothetical protein PHR19_02300 [Bacteroidales bacterium]|nr:hypothetical protein [Bacteroidales bacterium]